MKFKLKQITESDFIKEKCQSLSYDSKLSRTYLKISIGTNKYKLSWQSEVVFPDFIMTEDDFFIIGVDFNFVIIDIKHNKVLLNKMLDYYYYDCIFYKNWILIITQLEILRIDKNILEVVEIYSLPDFFEEIKFYENEFVVKCIDNQFLNFSLK